MGKIKLEDLQPGMILAGQVKERGGRVLLGPGIEISEKHLDILRKWGITEAEIEGVNQENIAPTPLQIDPAVLQEAEARASELFRHTDREYPPIKELFRLCALRLARHRPGGKVQ